MKPPKPKKCKWCKELFTPRFSTTERTCHPPKECSWQLAAYDRQQKRAKETRTLIMERNAQSLSWQHKQTQIERNKNIRVRDHADPCISCGINYGQMQAGHYRSIGAAPHLRYNEDNIHKQCSQCNQKKSGNILEYRIRLIAKIGVERVEALEADNQPRKYTIVELEALRAHYKQKTKDLKAELPAQYE